MIRFIVVWAFFVAMSAAHSCDDRLLVSDYSGNDVRIFNACTGEYLRDLDNQGRLEGPQAIQIGEDGLIYVVSEENARVVRYSADNWEFVDVLIDSSSVGPISRPTGLIILNNELLLAGFQSDNIGRYDLLTGQFKSLLASTGTGGLDGPDAGMAIDTNGDLLVPSFENNSLLQFDPATGDFLGLLAGVSDGLNAPRVILVDPETGVRWVTSWRNGQIIEIDAEGNSSVLASTFRPSGLARDPVSGDLIVASDSNGQISRVNLQTGELTTLIDSEDNPLQAATFIQYLTRSALSSTQKNEQYWITGNASISEQFELVVPQMISAIGGAFGSSLDPDQVERRPWGSITIQFNGCNSAELLWDSNGEDSENFGTGGYSLERLTPSQGLIECEAQGYDNLQNPEWISGTWYGGPPRSGEGFLIDVFGDQAFVAWFTYHRAVPVDGNDTVL